MSFSSAISRKRTAATALAILLATTATACKRAEQGQPGGEEAAPASAESAATAPQPAPAESTTAGSASATGVTLPGAGAATYVAHDYSFEGPASLPAGWTTFVLQNRGKELHHLVVFRLNEGKTAQDLGQVLQAEGAEGEAEFPKWAVMEGGPVGIPPGGESDATLALEPGNYVVICLIPSSDGVPHMGKGMLQPVEVGAPTGTAPSEPQADLTIDLVDYDFQIPSALRSGRYVLRVDNTGSEPHEVVMWQLPPGKTLADVLTWVGGGLAGPPPALPVAGLSPIRAGGHAYSVMNLSPGDYALICFVPDEEDGKPHYAHGMAKQITVQ
jgi:uncharacterized cupredoxin-like copper-binding protein